MNQFFIYILFFSFFVCVKIVGENVVQIALLDWCATTTSNDAACNLYILPTPWPTRRSTARNHHDADRTLPSLPDAHHRLRRRHRRHPAPTTTLCTCINSSVGTRRSSCAYRSHSPTCTLNCWPWMPSCRRLTATLLCCANKPNSTL